MPSLIEIAESVERLMESGQSTDEGLLDHLYTYSVINKVRAAVLRADFSKSKRWSHQALQTFYPDFETYYQNSVCYTRFNLPTGFIQANASQDGLVYFGSDGVQIYESQNFDRIKNRAELNDFLNNSRTNKFDIPAVLIEGLVATVLSKNNLAENLMVVGVLDDPTKLETYNLNDPYPISEDLLQQIYEVIQRGTMDKVYSRPPDYISNTNPVIPAK